MHLARYANPGFRLGFHDFEDFFGSSLFRRFDDALYSFNNRLQYDETDEAYVLTLELPGFKQEDVSVTVEGLLLSIEAKRGEKRYSTSVTLPYGVDTDKTDAKLEDGVLTINLAKAASAKSRKVEVK